METIALHIIKHYYFIPDKINISILRPLPTLYTSFFIFSIYLSLIYFIWSLISYYSHANRSTFMTCVLSATHVVTIMFLPLLT